MALRVLVVDDEPDIRTVLRATLERHGCSVAEAENGKRIVTSARRHKADIVLLDIMFPEKKTRGFEAAAEIKEKYPDLPILAFTAINREYAFDFAQEDIQAEEFINKPVETEKLVELIKKYTSK